MASRPAKRRRREPDVQSNQDGDDVPPVEVPVRTPKKQTQLELGGSSGSPLTFSPSPAKEVPKRGIGRKASNTTASTKPRKGGADKDVNDKNTTLSSFFSKATEDQRWHRKTATPEFDSIAGDEEDAIIDDELSDDAMLAIEAAKHDEATNAGLDRRQLSRTGPETRKSTTTSDHSRPGSKRFMKVPPTAPNKPDLDSNVPQQEQGHRPWADRYGPANLDELAVHKKKVQDVQRWLDDALSGRHRQRMLLLKGPAGSGKTTTISLLAGALGFQPISWQNPVSYDAGGAGSVATQFDDFLNRGGQFGSLSFQNDNNAAATLHRNIRPVLLVEEFPASTSSSGVESFRRIVQQFLARPAIAPSAPFRAQQPTTTSPPLVMIISETLLSSSTAFSDSFTAHRLLGPEILNHSFVNVVEFNPVAPTFVGKALDLVIRKEARDSGRRRMPGPAVLQHLTEMGDVRNAINTLEFLCIRNLDSNWSGTVASRAKKSKAGAMMTDMEKNSLRLLSQRETTLDMFHAAGKIMYNKRDEPTDPPPKPPDYLVQHHRPKVSQVDIDVLLNETGTDIQTFISTLHENYLLSCSGEAFVDNFEACSEELSASDVLNPDSRRQFRSRAGGLNSATAALANIRGGITSSDALRQDEISFHTATRGLLFHLPYPVNRAAGMNNGRKSDAFKMFYPVSLRLWRSTEEVDSLIGLFSRSTASLIPKAASASAASSNGVATWRTPNFGGVHHSTASSHLYYSEADDNSQPGRPFPPQPSRDELVLDILPHLALIGLRKKQQQRVDEDYDDGGAVSKTASLLQRIVRFNGIDPDLLHRQDEPSESSSTLSSTSPVKWSNRLAAKTDDNNSNKTNYDNNHRGASMQTAGGTASHQNKLAGTTVDGSHGVGAGVDTTEILFLEDDDIVDD